MSLDHRIVMPPAEEFQGLSPEELPKGLEGLVVVELGDYVAMPACTRALGEMGATVYKIETIKGCTAATALASACRSWAPTTRRST